MRKVIYSKKGFTLVELMVVVVILGILTSICAPLFYQAKRSMNRLCCQAQQDYLRSAITEYTYGKCNNMYFVYQICVYTQEDIDTLNAAYQKALAQGKHPQPVTVKAGDEYLTGSSQKGYYTPWTAGSFDTKTHKWTDEHSQDKSTPTESDLEYGKDGTSMYLYYDTIGGKTVVREIHCATEGERFIRYTYGYKGDINNWKWSLDPFGHDCDIYIHDFGNGVVKVDCKDTFHHDSTKDVY